MIKNNNLQKIRFMMVGGVNTAIDFGLLFIFKFIGIPTISSNLLSTTFAFIFSFVANKKYTFKSNSNDIRRELLLFVVVTLFGLWVIQSVIIWLSVDIIDQFLKNNEISVFIAKIIATVFTLVWNYMMYARVVFINK